MYSYEGYKAPSSPILPGSFGSSDSSYWDSSGFSTTPFSVQQDRSGFDWTGLLYGLGAAAEGAGNLMSNIRGDDRPPSRMAGQALQKYLEKDKPDMLTTLLSEIIGKRMPGLKKEPSQVNFAEIFLPGTSITG